MQVTQTRHIRCTYCTQSAQLVSGQIVYPYYRKVWEKKFWYCQPCAAWVGCHAGGDMPLGTFADSTLRIARKAAHSSFDDIWKLRKIPRSDAYNWLAVMLGIPRKQCHIAQFDTLQCRRVLDAVAALKAFTNS